ncbi:MAG: hypothetical protein AUK27_05150 [Deltaproteobacteria bacterium CG2_30_66_27]|nr:MAG: hypothetical protein AUK27_05150 [Deltaproteobacteria bacterium CG2_30_66_27]PJB33182.1 MAG: hypothetical protein CO109_00555 [Deltaproteobacteria bacterium CG_4_9_14_3_um_filter_65_9]
MFITVRTRKSLGEVRQRFEEAAAEHKFGVLGVHDVGDRLRAKGLSFDRKFYVYEVCNPVAAKKVLDVNVRIGTALPCRVTIYTDGGEVVLETLKPTTMLAMFDEPTLDGTARDIETAIESMMKDAAK